MLSIIPQIRHWTHRFGRHGPKLDFEHERSRIRGDGLQQDGREGRRVPEQRCQRHKHRWRPFAPGTGRLAEKTPSRYDARKRYRRFYTILSYIINVVIVLMSCRAPL